MKTCPAMRPELEALPPYMTDLPLDERGYPVPWFVAWPNGKPEFRAADAAKFSIAVRDRRCWVCGKALGKKLVFAIGPMCGINRVTGEPAAHEQCARWSARNCPFLNMREKRRRGDVTEEVPGARPEVGVMLKHNPGVTLLWFCTTFTVFDDGKGGKMISLGEPSRVEFYARGRRATDEEVDTAISLGLPALQALDRTPAGVEYIANALRRFNATIAALA